jgi:hypothetical protein
MGMEEEHEWNLWNRPRAGTSRRIFVLPTLFEAKPGMRIIEDEIFGPVIAVMPFESEEQAAEMANDLHTAFGRDLDEGPSCHTGGRATGRQPCNRKRRRRLESRRLDEEQSVAALAGRVGIDSQYFAPKCLINSLKPWRSTSRKRIHCLSGSLIYRGKYGLFR